MDLSQSPKRSAWPRMGGYNTQIYHPLQLARIIHANLTPRLEMPAFSFRGLETKRNKTTRGEWKRDETRQPPGDSLQPARNSVRQHYGGVEAEH